MPSQRAAPFLLLLGLTACGHAASRTENASAQDASNPALDNMAAMADNATDSWYVAPLELDALNLVASTNNDNDFRSGKVRALPGSLANAAFGFFDDEAILAQIPKRNLMQMAASDFGYRFVADLDRNGREETYRTGWYRLPGEEAAQFLAVFEDQKLRDVFATDYNFEPLSISWHDGKPTLFPCNCPNYAPIVYARGKLRMRWVSG